MCSAAACSARLATSARCRRPNYESALANRAIHTLSDGSKVFAGQRAEGFYVDLGSIFDLGNLRPFQNLNVFAQGPAARHPASTRPSS